MEVLISSFQTLFTFDVLIALVAGVVFGMVVGALPGFTATMGVSLLLPITVGMEAVPALVMLASLYTSSTYGGSMTAILLHTPGTAASGATADDGFALTLKGKGLQAIGVSTVTSCAGGFLSGIALIFISPLLARLSLLFGPGEYLFVALFGLTIIGSLCQGGVVKGMLCACIGLVVACVGIDPVTSYSRYTFGSNALGSGFGLVPSLIGLFSISQVMIMAEMSKESSNEGIVNKTMQMLKGKILLPLVEWKNYIIPVIRSFIIGLFVGILPGAGGDIGSWLSYNAGKQQSKHPEEYGKGSLEAIACSETANNAVCGGALVPLLTLGVPGSATAAVLLGGLTMHGLVPGNDLFTVQAGITYPIMLGFTLSNFLMAIIGLIAARYFIKVTAIPVSILAPVIIVLATLGSYAVQYSMVDVWSMVAFGALGYIMRKHDMVTAPIVLALILGPMAETKLIQSRIAARSTPLLMYFMSRPICVILTVLIVISIAVPVIQSRKQKKKSDTIMDEE